MTKLSKFSLAALGGVTMLVMAIPADAAASRSKFRASVDEVRRYCERLDESFWKKRQWYGCGDKLGCKNGGCVLVKTPPPPVYDPPRFYSEGGKGGKGGDRGAKSGGNDNGGGGNGAGSAGRGSSGPN